jgi:hypothetical protein
VHRSCINELQTCQNAENYFIPWDLVPNGYNLMYVAAAKIENGYLQLLLDLRKWEHPPHNMHKIEYLPTSRSNNMNNNSMVVSRTK